MLAPFIAALSRYARRSRVRHPWRTRSTARRHIRCRRDDSVSPLALGFACARASVAALRCPILRPRLRRRYFPVPLLAPGKIVRVFIRVHLRIL